MVIDPKLLGKRIQQARKQQHLTQAALAERMDLSSNYIACIEIGKNTPSLETFVDLCNQLKVSPEVLLADSIQKESDKIKETFCLSDLNCTNEELQYAIAIARFSIEEKRRQKA